MPNVRVKKEKQTFRSSVVRGIIGLSVTVVVLFFTFSVSTAGTVNYQYDQLERLIRVVYPGGEAIEYVYDAVGNRISVTITADLDSDGDGLPDSLENTSCTSIFDSDTDDDGISDGLEDANKNGTVDLLETDPCDADSDNDGIQDGTELGYSYWQIDSDTDDSIFQEDMDPSTRTNPINPDTDGDGLIDGDEDSNYNGLLEAWESDPNTFDLTNRAMSWLLLLLGADIP